MCSLLQRPFLRKPRSWRAAPVVRALLCWPLFLLLPLLQSLPLWASEAPPLRVAAAASLTDAITALSRVYEKSHPGQSVQLVLAGSAALAKQLEQGAPVDLFIAADTQWMDYLLKRQLLREPSLRTLASNRLVLVAPGAGLAPWPATQAWPQTLAGRLCTGDPDYVPVGRYARQALEKAGLWARWQERLVRTDDVRKALALVARGECALGIVYRTDAQSSSAVSVLREFDPASHSPIVYPMALTRRARPEAQAFWEFLQSPRAAQLLAEQGFLPAPGSASAAPSP